MTYVRAFLLLAASVAPMMAYAQAQPGLQQSQRYVDCTVKSRSNPTQTLQEANAWFASTKEPAAQHCVALSLYNLRRYEDAAMTLEQLANTIGNDQMALKVSVLTQGAYAWKLATRYDMAEKDYQNAIALASGNNLNELTVNLLYERAQLFVMQQKNLNAMQDLDHMLTLEPRNVKARMLRGSVFEALGQNGAAREDYQAVLEVEPNNADAKAALAKVGPGENVPPPPNSRKKKAVAAKATEEKKKTPAKKSTSTRTVKKAGTAKTSDSKKKKTTR